MRIMKAVHQRIPSAPPRKFRGKHARNLSKAVIAAGGAVTLTAGGHLRVTGPLGVAVVGSCHQGFHSLKNAVSQIRRSTGLHVTVS